MRGFLLGLTLVVVPSAACSPAGDPSSGSGGSGGASRGGASGASQGGSPAGTGGANPGTSGGSSSGGSTALGGAAGSAQGGVTAQGGASSGGVSGSSSGGAAGSGGSTTSGGSGTGGGSAGSAGGGGYTGKVIVVDDFDKSAALAAPDPAKWRGPSVGDSNQPVIDSSRSHSPPNSLKVTGTSIGNGSFLVPLMGALPTADNRFFVRVYVSFEKATSAITGHIGFIVGADSRDNSGTELRLGISTPPGFPSAMLDLNLQNPKDGGGGEVTRFSNGYTTGGNPLNMPGFTLEANRWYCVESLFDGGMNEFRVWIDDSEVTALHVTDFSANSTPRTRWAPSFSVLKIGVQNYGGDAGQIWYDDVVVGSERIRCN